MRNVGGSVGIAMVSTYLVGPYIRATLIKSESFWHL
jgi:hypothetical protein